MSETEPEPGQACYMRYAADTRETAPWPQWETLQTGDRLAWAKQETAERWRAGVKPLEGGSHEAEITDRP